MAPGAIRALKPSPASAVHESVNSPSTSSKKRLATAVACSFAIGLPSRITIRLGYIPRSRTSPPPTSGQVWNRSSFRIVIARGRRPGANAGSSAHRSASTPKLRDGSQQVTTCHVLGGGYGSADLHPERRPDGQVRSSGRSRDRPASSGSGLAAKLHTFAARCREFSTECARGHLLLKPSPAPVLRKSVRSTMTIMPKTSGNHCRPLFQHGVTLPIPWNGRPVGPDGCGWDCPPPGPATLAGGTAGPLGRATARLGREIANGANPERPNNEPPGPAIMEPLCRTARQRKGRYAITIIEKTTYSHCLRFFQQGVAPSQL